MTRQNFVQIIVLVVAEAATKIVFQLRNTLKQRIVAHKCIAAHKRIAEHDLGRASETIVCP